MHGSLLVKDPPYGKSPNLSTPLFIALMYLAVWDKYLDIWIDSNIFRQIYSFAKICGDFFLGEFIWIFICDLFIMTYIFWHSFVHYLWWQIYSSFNLFLKMVQKGLKCSKISRYGQIWSTIIKNGECGQNSLNQCWTNILILKYM